MALPGRADRRPRLPRRRGRGRGRRPARHAGRRPTRRRSATSPSSASPTRSRRSARVAAGWRRRFDPLVVGVTGSIAKTSTKEAVAAVLGAPLPDAAQSEGNQNNEIGLPLTLLRLGPEHEAAVLEMGMYVGGEIADLARIARPCDRGRHRGPGRSTCRGSARSRRSRRPRASCVEALPADGTAILNADDPIVRADGGADRGAGRRPTASPPTPTSAPRRSTSAGLDGMRFTLRAGGRAAAGRRSRRSAGSRSTTRSPPRPSGSPPACRSTRSSAGLADGWSAPHRVDRRPSRRRDDRRRHLQRLARLDASPRSTCWPGCPGRRVAVLGEMLELGDGARRRPSRRRRGRRPGRRPARRRRRRRRAAIAEGARRRPAWTRRGSVRVARRRRRPGRPAAAAARRRRRPRQGLARDRPRPRSSTALRAELGRGAAR